MILPNVHWTWRFSLFIASWGAQERDGSSWRCELQSSDRFPLLFAQSGSVFAWLKYSSWHLYTCTVRLFRKAVSLWVLVLQPWSGEEGLRWPTRFESCVMDTCHSCSHVWGRQKLTKTLSKSSFSWLLTWLSIISVVTATKHHEY